MCSLTASKVLNIQLGIINALISAAIVVYTIIKIASGEDLFGSEDKTSAWLGIPRSTIDITFLAFHVFYFFGNICLVIGSFYEETMVMIPIAILSITSIILAILFTVNSNQDLYIAAGYSGFICLCIIISCCLNVKIRSSK